MNKEWCLNEAINLTKEYARGGANGNSPHVVLEDLYKMLLELKADAKK